MVHLPSFMGRQRRDQGLGYLTLINHSTVVGQEHVILIPCYHSMAFMSLQMWVIRNKFWTIIPLARDICLLTWLCYNIMYALAKARLEYLCSIWIMTANNTYLSWSDTYTFEKLMKWWMRRSLLNQTWSLWS